ncbi:armadillo-type protein [Lipomyces kononenkoae]|uniref:Armadillo-type protein n=1 Tax=Lipomyces kononenkoae TaxID=34357 RepID=A0ACC3T7P1_LIPKO
MDSSAGEPTASWKDLRSVALTEAFSSSTKKRTQLFAAIASAAKASELASDLPLILHLIFSTYSLYDDHASRMAVMHALKALLESDLSTVTDKFVPALKREAEQKGMAAADYFVLLEWVNQIIHVLCKQKDDLSIYSSWLPELVAIQAICLDNTLSSVSDKKSRLARATEKSAKAALVLALTQVDDSCSKYLDLLATKTSSLVNASLIGILAATVAELKVNQLAYKVVLDRRSEIYAFYIREILGSKTVVSQHNARALSHFFQEFLTKDDFTNNVAAPLERAILRSPETVLGPVSLQLVKSIPPSVDCAEAVLKHLVNPLLSALKSSKESVREYSSQTLSALFKKCYDEEITPKIANELLAPLKASKVTVPEQRAMYGQALSSLPRSMALTETIPAGLAALASKEMNELAMRSIVTAIFHHTKTALDSDSVIDKVVLDSIVSGLADKRANLRRYWIMSLGDFVLSASSKPSKAVVSFLEKTLPKLLDTWKEVNTSPTAAVQSKIIVAGHVFTCIAKSLVGLNDPAISGLIAKAKVVEAAFTLTPKPSFLLFDRIYTKLSTADEQLWAVRALRSTAADVESNTDSGTAWALAFIYFITSCAIDSRVRLQATSLLAESYSARPRVISNVVISALWRWIAQLEDPSAKEQSPAITLSALKRLRIVLQTLTPMGDAQIPVEILQDQLVQMVVLTHHHLLESSEDWIMLCQRVSVDPGRLVAAKTIELQAVVTASAANDEQSERTLDAAMKAAATLAFVSPDVFAPFVRDKFIEDLDASRLDGITEEDVRIWRTPDGVLCIDVLNSNSDKSSVNKNAKDYANLKWEAEVRAELAKKAAPGQKKLTKDEQSKVNEQLAREKAIRGRLQDAYWHVCRGVKLIHFLCAGTNNGPEIWFGPATESLVAALQNNISLLLGSLGIDTYLELAEKLNTRVGPLRKFIGVSLLRAINVTGVDKSLAEESLRELVTRILYRLRFLSEQIPLDAISLIYILPIILLVFEKMGIDCSNSEEKDEQLILAIDILTLHTETFASTSVPRLEVLKNIISLMTAYPSRNKGAKECLLGICQSIAMNITDEELNVMLAATISSDSFVRGAVLEAIDTEFEISHIGHSHELWIASHDENELNAKVASSIWEENGLDIDEDTPVKMLPYLENVDAQVRGATSRAVADALEQKLSDKPTLFHDFLQAIMELYRERAKPPAAIYDEFGMIVKSSLEQKDPWEVRSGIAATFKQIARIFPESELSTFLRFLIDDGPLGDKDATVRQQMQEAGVLILYLHAKNEVDSLMPMLETCLGSKHTGSEVQDRIKECAIVLYATLARHLDDDARLPSIIDRLITTLKAPSENVQFAVSESLPPLITRVDNAKVGQYVEQLVQQLFGANKYSERRGAAFGISGVVKGTGISALADYDIIRSLTIALEDKKDPKKRQGVQFAFETLSMSLGRNFEPYVIEILPLLLSSLGDASPEVREATADAAKEIMKHTTSYGIKQLIPLTLESFNQTQWRSKKGSVELLGTMAYLDPRQLSESLSSIIPEIVGALNDTHKEVRKAASLSLQRFGEVISNPEIQNLVPALLKAISDPTKYVDEVLELLLKTSFVHYIDAPSLALIIYILHRGLRERSASTKRKACQIVGNMASLTDSKDLVPYLDSIVAELEISMVDPVPATQAMASRALGSLIEKLGEDQMPDLIPKLLNMLRADNNEGDRVGAAQALSEVVSGLGTRKLEELLPTILKSVSSPKANIRESFMNLMIFLPVAFGNNFSPYLARVIPPILAGLADDVEPIRDTSLRAGRLIVKNYATRAVDLLLPELERGLSDENYRIRLSSIELTGDLLFQITGVSKSTMNEDNEEQQQQEEETVGGEVHSSLREVLGDERRDRILAALYVCRSDVTAVVRNAAVEIWKSLVPNTPRTVKDILPVLSQLIIRRLSSPDEDQRENASQTLSDLVRRFGESLLAQFLPTLESGLYSNDPDAKQGICLALSELIESTPVGILESHESALMAFVRSALVDPDANVREAAAHTFDTVHEIFGDTAINQILPHLLNLLQTVGQSEYALAAFKEIMSMKSHVIFPVLIPVLLKGHVTAFNARALGSLAEVAGSALYEHLQKIIDALFDTLLMDEDDDDDGDQEEEVNKAIDTIVASIGDEEGVELLMDIFLELAEDESPRKRSLAFDHIATYFESADVDDYSEYAQKWVRHGLAGLDDGAQEVVMSAWKSLSILLAKLHKEDILELVIPTNRQLQAVGSRGTDMAGFALPKGPNAILPIFSQGLMYGTSDQREQAARGIAEVVERTPAEVLRPFVTQIVGPLIRTVGERVPAEVKVAILDTLAVMLAKIPAFLRPFLPQLQRTFTKSLTDSTSEGLQESAQKALDVLASIQPARK